MKLSMIFFVNSGISTQKLSSKDTSGLELFKESKGKKQIKMEVGVFECTHKLVLYCR